VQKTEFKSWLQAQEYSTNTIATWLSDGGKVDRAYDLDRKFEEDACEGLLEELVYSRSDEAGGAPNPSALTITGPLYRNLAACRAAVRAYVRFRSSRNDVEGRLSGLDRQIVLEAIAACEAAGSAAAFVATLEDRGQPQKYWLLHAGKRYPSKAIVHWAMRERGIEASAGGSMCKATLEELGFVVVDWPELQRSRDAFLGLMPGFTDFRVTSGEYWDVERSYKNALIAEARRILEGDDEDRAVGERLFRLLSTGGSGRPLSWRTLSEVEAADDELTERFYRALGRLARSEAPAEEAIPAAARELEALRQAGIAGLRRGEVLSISITVFATVHPEDASWFKIAKIEQMGKRFFGRKLFPQNDFREADLAEWLQLMRALFALLDREFGWHPQDLFDVQGFAWVALGGNEQGEFLHLFDADGAQYTPLMQKNRETGTIAYRIRTGTDNTTGSATETQSLQDVARALLIEKLPVRIAREGESHANYLTFPGKLVRWHMSNSLAESLDLSIEGPDVAPPAEANHREKNAPMPTNLILFGPPGTGKTYRTVREAVRLCGETVPDDRGELMAAYNALVRRRRIAFTTFHQNYSYEEFVQGLRPDTGAEAANGEGEGDAGGFSLKPRDGVFKETADLAAANRGRAAETERTRLDPAQKVFKMSLGRARAAEDDHIFADAIEGGYVVLGYGGDIDWAAPEFDEFDTIKRRWQADHPEATGNDPNIAQIFTLRANMEVGSYVVISDGNLRFRAIGQVTGPYEFAGGTDDYKHRRPVRWLWHSDASLGHDQIYEKIFSQVSAYQFNSRLINWDAMQQIVDSSGEAGETVGPPEPYVLVIDEINRANVSKVFGELITLIEPDKRIGAANELRAILPYSGERFGVPSNLHIIGTMNTADRSIALLDTALRRRFRFEEIAPDPALLPELVDDIPLRRVLEVMNERIEYLHDREHRIGHAFFMGGGGGNRGAIDATMRDRIVPLLQEYFFDDWSRVAAVVGDGFVEKRKLPVPPGIEAGEDRWSWSVRPDFPPDAYDRLIGKAPGHAAESQAETP